MNKEQIDSIGVEITADQVKKLRQQTGCGMMDCKKALAENQGDFNNAIIFLRKKGAKIATSRADRETKEGLVITQIAADATQGIIFKLNCETDFVAKNTDFQAIGAAIAALCIKHEPSSVANLLNLPFSDGLSVTDSIQELIGKIGEKIEVSDYDTLKAPQVVAYNHAGGKIGVLVGLSMRSENTEQAGKDIGMQIAAMNPLAIDKANIDADTVERETEIAKEQARAEGKLEEMIDKIAEGKLAKFYKENVLLEQEFVQNDPSKSKKTVAQYLQTVQADLMITDFKRVQLG